jgi:hypothetical protein
MRAPARHEKKAPARKDYCWQISVYFAEHCYFLQILRGCFSFVIVSWRKHGSEIGAVRAAVWLAW